VVFVFVTDGEENSSREFTRDQIRKMVEHQQLAYKWPFTFLAANQDAFAARGPRGFDLDGIAEFLQEKCETLTLPPHKRCPVCGSLPLKAYQWTTSLPMKNGRGGML
jgi:hypothetical protein